MQNLNRSQTLAPRLFSAALFLASAGSTFADMHYVDLNSSNSAPPYLSWTTAATNITP